MFKRLEIKKIFAFLLVTCMLAGGIAALPATVYAVPEEEPATTEVVGEDANAEAGIATLEEPVVSPSQTATGITIEAADEEEEDVNPMDTILGFDTIIKNIWSKICSRLLIILAILVAIVIGILIYIMATQTNKLSKQNQAMSRRPNRALASEQPAAQGEESVRQVKQFGDTLRIRRTVQQGGAPAQQANMQRPVAPQRPSRPAQGQMMQPGVRRPIQAQPGQRPVQGQPQRRPVQGQPQRPVQGQPQRRPVQGQPQRPVQGQPMQRPMQGQPMQRPVQRPMQPPQDQQ